MPVVVWERAGSGTTSGWRPPRGRTPTGQRDLVHRRPGTPAGGGVERDGHRWAGTAGDIGQVSPNANAAVIARLPGTTTASIFAYETGAAMPGLTAPARRVGLFMWDTTPASFTAGGTALFDAAISWATAQTSQSPTPTPTPPTPTPSDPDADADARHDPDAH